MPRGQAADLRPLNEWAFPVGGSPGAVEGIEGGRAARDAWSWRGAASGLGGHLLPRGSPLGCGSVVPHAVIHTGARAAASRSGQGAVGGRVPLDSATRDF